MGEGQGEGDARKRGCAGGTPALPGKPNLWIPAFAGMTGERAGMASKNLG